MIPVRQRLYKLLLPISVFVVLLFAFSMSGNDDFYDTFLFNDASFPEKPTSLIFLGCFLIYLFLESILNYSSKNKKYRLFYTGGLSLAIFFFALFVYSLYKIF